MNAQAIFTSALSVLLFISGSVNAQKGRWATTDDTIARELIAKEKMWSQANCAPQPGLKDVFADEFMGTAPDGTRYGKAQAMETDMKNRDRECKLGDIKIQFFGDAIAIAYGSESSIRKGKDGKELKRCLVWTDTWIRRDGKWEIISAQDVLVNCPE